MEELTDVTREPNFLFFSSVIELDINSFQTLISIKSLFMSTWK